MADVYKTVTEHIRIECESFESVQEQVALLSDARSIEIKPHEWTDDDGERQVTWYIEAERPQPDNS